MRNLQGKAHDATNGDVIRAMTDTELAAFLKKFWRDDGGYCKNKKECAEIVFRPGEDIPDEWCQECALDWLKTEADAGEVPIPDRWYAETRWNVEDLISIAAEQGIEMTPEQADRWWRDHERAFTEQLIQTGNEMLAQMDKEVD